MYTLAIIVVVILLICLKFRVPIRDRMRKAQDQRKTKCGWCHKPLYGVGMNADRAEMQSCSLSGRVHVACEEEALRRHKGYAWFFTVLALFGIFSMSFGLLGDALREHKLGWKEIQVLGPAVMSFFVLPRMIWPTVCSWSKQMEERRKSQSADEPPAD